MRPPCSWSPEGHGGLQAGTPARRRHPVSGRAGVPRASPGQRAGRGRLPGGPGRSVLPPRSPAASEVSEQSRLVDPRFGAACAAERPGGMEPGARGQGPGMGGGRRDGAAPVGPRASALASCPPPPSAWRGRLREPGAAWPAGQVVIGGWPHSRSAKGARGGC